MENKKWKRKDLILWTWQFIRENRRLPLDKDLTGTNAPNSATVLREFGTLENLINLSGPPQRSNNKPSLLLDLKKNMARFYKENGHYPTTVEIDACEYFPRVRSLERSWGGVTNLRGLFGLDVIDYSSGISRSNTARVVNRAAFDAERKMEERLVALFGEELVHVEKGWNKENKHRLDFFVYTRDGPFGVDVFNASTIFNLKVQVLLKQRQYVGAQFILFLVYTNPQLNDREVAESLLRKKTPLPENIIVLSINSFFAVISECFTRHPDVYASKVTNAKLREVHEKFHGK